MKTIIAGCRDFEDYDVLLRAIEKIHWGPSVVLSGAANGVDRLGERWANENGIPVDKYPANWSKHGKKAGPIRNADMAANADALLALWDGKSPGTRSMIDLAIKAGLVVRWWKI